MLCPIEDRLICCIELRVAIYELYLRPSDPELREWQRLDLLNVSHQICSEFRPVYLKSKIYIRLSKVDQFVEQFLTPDELKKAPIDLVIDLSRRHGAKPFNILPFLQKAIKNERFSIAFTCKGFGKHLAQTLTKVLRRNRQQWQALAFESVSEILLRPYSEGLIIAFLDRTFDSWIVERAIARHSFWAFLGFKRKHKIRREVFSDVNDFSSTDRVCKLSYGKWRIRITS
jgi:hypothetical protein